jgi:flagellar basal body-associated protein FliL
MSLSILLLLIVAGVLLALVVALAVFVLRDPEASKRRVEGIFRRPPRPPKAPGTGHYYRPYWS